MDGANFTQEKYDERISPDRRALISHVTNGMFHPLMERLVHKNVSRMFDSFMSATPVEEVRRMYANWVFDGKRRETSTIPEGSTGVLGEIDVPFVVVQNLGQFNVHQFGSYDLFENAGTPTSPSG